MKNRRGRPLGDYHTSTQWVVDKSREYLDAWNPSWRDYMIWDCSAGAGDLVKGLDCLQTDIKTGIDFLDDPPAYDAELFYINPPYKRVKGGNLYIQFLHRIMEWWPCAHIACITPVSLIKNNVMDERFINRGAFMFPSETFPRVSKGWGILFSIWENQYADR